MNHLGSYIVLNLPEFSKSLKFRLYNLAVAGLSVTLSKVTELIEVNDSK